MTLTKWLLCILTLCVSSATGDELSALDRLVASSHFIAVARITSEPTIVGTKSVFLSKPIPDALVEYSFNVDIQESLYGNDNICNPVSIPNP